MKKGKGGGKWKGVGHKWPRKPWERGKGKKR